MNETMIDSIGIQDYKIEELDLFADEIEVRSKAMAGCLSTAACISTAASCAA